MFGKNRKGQAAIKRTPFSARSHKGQAAMEYLMTYGWAILVIVIVLGTLAFLLPSLLTAPEECRFKQTGFSCDIKKPVIVSETSTNDIYVRFRLDNQQSQAVKIKGVLCTTSSGEIDKTTISRLSSEQRVPAGSYYEFTDKIFCLDDSNPPQQVVSTPNSNFRGTLVVLYNYENEVTNAPERMATATISGTVLSE